MRLNCVDHYQADPSRFDPQLSVGSDGALRSDGLPKVPVIRVFGATQTGQKLCAYIHGALPYVYIDYDGAFEPDEGHFLSNYTKMRIG